MLEEGDFLLALKGGEVGVVGWKCGDVPVAGVVSAGDGLVQVLQFFFAGQIGSEEEIAGVFPEEEIVVTRGAEGSEELGTVGKWSGEKVGVVFKKQDGLEFLHGFNVLLEDVGIPAVGIDLP